MKNSGLQSELDPGDFHAILFGYVVPEVVPPPPKPPVDLKKIKEEDELQIRDFRDGGATDDELPTPWNECSPCEQAQKIPEILERKYGDKIQQIAQSYADELAEKMNSVALGYAPLWKNSHEDYLRWDAGIKWFTTTGKLLKYDAENALGTVTASLLRQMGREILSYSSFYMDCALKQAEAIANQGFNELYSRTKDLPVTAGSYADVKADIYQGAYEEAIKQCYLSPMQAGASYLSTKSEPAGLPKSNVEVYNFQYWILAWPSACVSIQGYCEEDFEPNTPSTPFDNTFSINLLIVSFEYNYDTEAWELRVAPETGIILGAHLESRVRVRVTQAGVDLGLDLKVIGFDLQCYFEVDKTGMHIKGETGAFVNLGILEAGLERSISQTLIPFQAVPGEATPLSETE